MKLKWCTLKLLKILRHMPKLSYIIFWGWTPPPSIMAGRICFNHKWTSLLLGRFWAIGFSCEKAYENYDYLRLSSHGCLITNSNSDSRSVDANICTQMRCVAPYVTVHGERSVDSCNKCNYQIKSDFWVTLDAINIQNFSRLSWFEDIWRHI